MGYIRKKVPINSHPELWDETTFKDLWVKYSTSQLTKILGVSPTAIYKAVLRFKLKGLKTRSFGHKPRLLGVKRVTENGYIRIRTDKGWEFEHRVIMAQHLGRQLLRSEIIHHRNGQRNDNRLENLELLSPQNHIVKTEVCINCQLRKEIRLLRWQVKELAEALQEKLKLDS